MAKEVRSILFTADEVREAVASAAAKRSGVGCSPDLDRVDIRVVKGVVMADAMMRTGTALLQLDHAELLAAMLVYSRRSRIPLPTRSAKRLDVSNGCLVLTMALNPDPIAPRVEGRTVIHAALPLLPATQRLT